MQSNSNHDECEFDRSFFSNLVESDTNDIYIETQIEDGVPNTRERPGMGIKELRYKRKAEVAIGRDPCPDTRDWSKAKRLRADQKGTVIRNDMLPFDIIANKKSAAQAIWQPSLGLAEVTQMRGNFWRTTGFCTNKKSYLYPEEALLLAERSVLLVESEGQRITYHKLYEKIIGLISLECHLAYLKLKTLDYLVFRHSKTVQSFEGDADVFRFLLKNPGTSLLKAVVAYDVYSHTHKWSKKMMSEPPAGYIVVMTGDLTFSGRVLLRLLDEAKGIPIIFAAVMPTGHVMLEEFSDSINSLNWENVYAKPIEFKSKIEKALELELEAKNSVERKTSKKTGNNGTNDKADDDTREEVSEDEGEDDDDDHDGEEEEEEEEEEVEEINIESDDEITNERKEYQRDEDERNHELDNDESKTYEKNDSNQRDNEREESSVEIESKVLGELAEFFDNEAIDFPLVVQKLQIQEQEKLENIDKENERDFRVGTIIPETYGTLQTPSKDVIQLLSPDRNIIDLSTPDNLSEESVSPGRAIEEVMNESEADLIDESSSIEVL